MGKNPRMFSSFIMCCSAFMLFNKCDGRLHGRNKLVRRQNAPMPPSSNMIQGSYPVLPPQMPILSTDGIPNNQESQYPRPPPPNSANFMPPFPSASFPGAPYPGSIPNLIPTLATYNPLSQNAIPNPVPLSRREYLFRKNAPENSYVMRNAETLNSYLNPSRERVERRRKNVLGKKHVRENGYKVHRNVKPASAKRKTKKTPEKMGDMEKLLEEGKKMLQQATTKSHFMGEETSLKSLENLFEESGEMTGNVTVIPIPEGIQLKTNSEKGSKHVEETVNITSSTQKTLTIDNNTEIENVMEMEMEKKIEDDKGDSKGSEQLKIVETERVKPIMIKKVHGMTHKHRKRRFPLRKLIKRHRRKRSTKHSASFYSKMMKKFLSDLKKRDRAAGMTSSWNRIESTTPGQSGVITKVSKKTGRVLKEEEKISVRDKSGYDSDEMEEFLKQILAELVKLRKTRDNKWKNKRFQYSHHRQKDDDLYFTSHRKKPHVYYPGHKKKIMNFNTTWDNLLKSENERERSEDVSTETTFPNTVTSTTHRAFTILYLNDKKDSDSRLIVVAIILCVMTFLLPLLLCILPQMYKTSKLKEKCSAPETCPFCPEPGSNKAKEGICRFHSENFAADEPLQLEWQSDNGDWLSEKEIEFK